MSDYNAQIKFTNLGQWFAKVKSVQNIVIQMRLSLFKISKLVGRGCSTLLLQTCWQELVNRPCSAALHHQRWRTKSAQNIVIQQRYTAGCSSRAKVWATPGKLGCFCALSSAILCPIFPLSYSTRRFWSAAFKRYQLFQSAATHSAIHRPRSVQVLYLRFKLSGILIFKYWYWYFLF